MPADRAYDLRSFASLYNTGSIVLFDTPDFQALRFLRNFVTRFPGELHSLPDSNSIHFLIRPLRFTPSEYYRIKNYCKLHNIRIISFHCPFGSGKRSNPRTDQRENDAIVLYDPSQVQSIPGDSIHNPIDLTEDIGSSSNPIILD